MSIFYYSLCQNAICSRVPSGRVKSINRSNLSFGFQDRLKLQRQDDQFPPILPHPSQLKMILCVQTLHLFYAFRRINCFELIGAPFFRQHQRLQFLMSCYFFINELFQVDAVINKHTTKNKNTIPAILSI